MPRSSPVLRLAVQASPAVPPQAAQDQASSNRGSQASTGTSAQSLTLSGALALAQQRSFVLQQYDARFQGAAARLTATGALLNPVLSVGAHVGHDAAGTDEDYILSQSFELGDKRRQRVNAARAERDAATFDQAATRNDLVFTVKSAYFEAQRADSAAQLARAALESARTFSRAAEDQFTSGDVPRAQVIRSQIEQNRSEQALSAAVTDLDNRLATLRSLVHLPDSTTLTVADKLSYQPINYRLVDLLTYAAAHRPDLQSAARLRFGREAQLHAARAASQPDLFIEARHANIDPAQGGDTLRFGLLFPLLDFGRNRADAANARAALAEQVSVLSEAQRTAQLEVETAYRNLEQARRVVEAFQGGRLDRSRELLDLAQLGYSRGANSFLELLDAQQVYRNEQTDYARALADYNIAAAALERAVGGRLP